MEPSISRLVLQDGIDLHVLRTRQFKTLLVRLAISVPLNAETASANALIAQITERVSRPWPELKAVNRRLDELYGASLYAHVNKVGERQVVEWNLNCAAPERVGQPTLLREALAFMRDMVLDPLAAEDGFDEGLFEQERTILLQEQEARQNDKMTYAYERTIEELCASEPYAVHRLGTAESLKAMSPQSAYAQYRRLLDGAKLDWVVVGDVDPAFMAEELTEIFAMKSRSAGLFQRETVRAAGSLRRLREPMDVKQGKLGMGFRTDIPYESSAYDAFTLMAMVFGGGASSKLFQTIREKESLCYSVYARAEKYKSLLIVGAGIDLDKAAVVEAGVLRELDLMRQGDFSDEELHLARLTLVRSLNALRDSQGGMADYYYNQHLSTRRYQVEETIGALQAVTRDAVMDAAGRVGLELVYFLCGKGEPA